MAKNSYTIRVHGRSIKCQRVPKKGERPQFRFFYKGMWVASMDTRCEAWPNIPEGKWWFRWHRNYRMIYPGSRLMPPSLNPEGIPQNLVVGIQACFDTLTVLAKSSDGILLG